MFVSEMQVRDVDDPQLARAMKIHRETEPSWYCQWCHGAAGIGLARIATVRRGATETDGLRTDIQRAVRCAEQAWPYPGDTLCCGDLCCGDLDNIELLNEASLTLERPQLRGEASQRLMAMIAAAETRGGYLLDGLEKRFRLGLFRGLSGVGYSLLRQTDPGLPNVLIWE
jgi:lantibiotic modifying enzyme